MSYNITVDDQRTLIVIKYAGAVTLEERARGVNDSAALLDSTGYRNVLVDLSDSTVVFGATKNSPISPHYSAAMRYSAIVKPAVPYRAWRS